MFSRRSATALVFACLATLSVAMAAEVRHGNPTQARATSSAVTVIQLPQVVVSNRAAPQQAVR